MSTDRFGSIGDLLTSRPQRKPATVHPLNVAAEDTPTRESRPAAGQRPKSTESTGGTRRVAFRLDPELHAQLVAHAKRLDLTHGNVVLDAIEAAHNAGILAELVAGAKVQPSPAPAGLFVRTAPRGAAAPSVPVEIQLHAQAVDQIDQLVQQHGADTRTQLITTALRRHLS